MSSGLWALLLVGSPLETAEAGHCRHEVHREYRRRLDEIRCEYERCSARLRDTFERECARLDCALRDARALCEPERSIAIREIRCERRRIHAEYHEERHDLDRDFACKRRELERWLVAELRHCRSEPRLGCRPDPDFGLGYGPDFGHRPEYRSGGRFPWDRAEGNGFPWNRF